MKKTPLPLSEEPPAFTTTFLRPNKEAGLEAQLSNTALALYVLGPKFNFQCQTNKN